MNQPILSRVVRSASTAASSSGTTGTTAAPSTAPARSLPAGGYATPSVYEVNGKQYVVIAGGGGKMGTKSGDAYLAFALPD